MHRARTAVASENWIRRGVNLLVFLFFSERIRTKGMTNAQNASVSAQKGWQTHKTRAYLHKRNDKRTKRMCIRTKQHNKRTIFKLAKFRIICYFLPPIPQSSPIKSLVFRLYNIKKRVFLGYSGDKLYSTKLFAILKLVLKIPIIVYIVEEGSICSNKYRLSLKI